MVKDVGKDRGAVGFVTSQIEVSVISIEGEINVIAVDNVTNAPKGVNGPREDSSTAG